MNGSHPDDRRRLADDHAAVGTWLQIDWARCRAHGHCAELLPELVSLDPWGYPVLAEGADTTVPEVLLEDARRAVSWCPNLALRLRRQP